ncbi:fibronectin type III domain-containing protein, partial [Pseudactinotalea sp.]|uniref:fibronectin type III domain-containing protein n=1 Tax=Pseudactinotalea sp. TaxID=1926260 RepID=UPI003B3B5863
MSGVAVRATALLLTAVFALTGGPAAAAIADPTVEDEVETVQPAEPVAVVAEGTVTAGEDDAGGGVADDGAEPSDEGGEQPAVRADAPKVSVVATAGGAQLTWGAVEGPGDPATHWVMIRSLDGGATWTAPQDVTTPFLDEGHAPGTQLSYQVAGVNAAGTGAWSAVATATVGPVPAKPVATATPKAGSVVLAWAAPASPYNDVQSYLVEYALSSGTWQTAATLPPTALGHTVTGLTNGTAYSFRVRALNAVGEGEWASLTATPRTVSSAPRSVTVSPSASTLTVRWSAPSSTGGTARTYYRVQYSTDSVTWTSASSTVNPSATSYTISGLKNGTTYRVRVLARNAAGDGAWSTVVSAKPRTVSSAPRTVKVSAGKSSLVVRWVAPSSSGGASRTAYIVQYSTDGRTWKTASRTVKPTATSYTITGLKNGTTYRVRVIAVNAAGNSAASSVVSGKPRTVPSKTAAKAASAGSGKVKISWSAPSNNGAAITGYVVQRYSGGTWKTVRTVSASARSVTITGLQNGTSYRFRVLARNAVGNG